LGRAAGVGDGVTLPSGDPVVADAWQFSHELLQKSDADDCPSEYPWRSIMRGADPAPGTWSSLGRYAPSPMSVVDQMLAFAEIDASDVVVDLGSGDGRLVIRAAEAYGVRGVGIDQEPALIAASIAASERAGVADRVTFTQADLMTADLSGATVIFLYLQGSFYGALGRRLRSHLRPGVRVVSHNVGFPDWLPTKTAIVAGGTNRAVFLYLWTIEDGSVSLLEPADATG
ncbi:MAG: class I SAM-dependent methyltransferase, partial [Acidobacteria bacterium]|nr:class I SAM-dependent methyltransferase [Acidobacteriota bacterium]